MGGRNLSRIHGGSSRRASALILTALLAGWSLPAAGMRAATAASAISKAAAERCDTKLKALEKFAGLPNSSRRQTTRFTEDEVNSYLALELGSEFHPCLKTLQMTFEEGNLTGAASIDFDKLGTVSTKFMPKLLSVLFSGTHRLDARGQLLSRNGEASFRLEQARFDNSNLPKSLVEEIITAVGKKQNPPFDPLQPSKLPYRIEEVDVHQGYITVHQ
jgi:hypothetical protein